MTNKKKIIILGILSEMCYLSFLFLPKLKSYFYRSEELTANLYLHVVIVGVLSFAFLLYLLASRQELNKDVFKIAILFAGLFNITLLLAWPISSTDILSYIGTGRILTIHHGNPFLVPFIDFQNDPLFMAIRTQWSDRSVIYGPLFVALSGALSFLGAKSVGLSLFFFKLAAISASLVSIYLIHKIFSNPKITLLLAWNPVFLFEFAVNGHNDIFAILLLLLSTYYLFNKENTTKNYLISLSFLCLSSLIKFITLPLIGIFGLIILKNIHSNKERMKFFVLAFAIVFGIFGVAYLPFFSSLAIFSGVFAQASFAMTFNLFASPVIFIGTALLFLLGVENYTGLASQIGQGLFVLIYIGLIIKLLLEKKCEIKKMISKYYFYFFLIFFSTFFTWLMPWYLSSLMIMLIVCFGELKKEKYKLGAFVVTLCSIAYYIVLR